MINLVACLIFLWGVINNFIIFGRIQIHDCDGYKLSSVLASVFQMDSNTSLWLLTFLFHVQVNNSIQMYMCAQLRCDRTKNTQSSHALCASTMIPLQNKTLASIWLWMENVRQSSSSSGVFTARLSSVWFTLAVFFVVFNRAIQRGQGYLPHSWDNRVFWFQLSYSTSHLHSKLTVYTISANRLLEVFEALCFSGWCLTASLAA